MARLSPTGLLARLAAGYVEVVRNVPLLVQLFFWYTIISEILPGPHDALNPLPGVFLSNRGIFFPLPGDVPELRASTSSAASSLSPEFAALLIGLVTYTAAFIAEIVRAGILSVSRGQVEAARSLGLDAPRRAAPRGAAAGAAPDRAADDQPVPEPHQEQLARGGDRLPGPGVDRQHHHEPDRPGDRGRGDHHGGVPHASACRSRRS
jgi:hypothetical protein